MTMLDKFLAASYSASRRDNQREKLAAAALLKMSHGDDPSWLSQFQGSPLAQQALQIAQQEIQLDQQDMAERGMRDQEMERSRMMWQQRDALRLQKRMLELQLAEQQLGAATAPELQGQAPEPSPAAAQGAGAPGEGTPQGLPETPKTSGVSKETILRMRMKAAAAQMSKAAALNAKVVEELGKGGLGAVRSGFGSMGKALSKGYNLAEGGGVGGAIRAGAKRLGTIAHHSPLAAGALVAAPAAAGLGAGYLGHKMLAGNNDGNVTVVR